MRPICVYVPDKKPEEKDEGKALKRRAKYFLFFQAASVLAFVLFSTFSVEFSEDEMDEDDGDEDM